MLLPKQYATRGPVRLGLLAMLVLLGLAWHFYLERVAYYDMAFQLFTFLRRQELFIQNRRFVAAMTELPTIWAVRAGWPIDRVMRLYSVAFVLYYLAVYLLSAKWFKNEQVALAVALLYVLLVSTTFYWAQSELPQALAALLLFYAGVARQAPLQRRFSTLALAALVPVFIFGHPLVLFPFLFLWAYDWLLNRRWRDWAYYGLLVLGLLTYGYRASLIPPGSYEANANSFYPNLLRLFPHYFDLKSYSEFWQLCRHNFVAVPILLALLTAYYVAQRSRAAWLRLGLLWVTVAGYTFVINVSFPDYGGPPYFENLFSPLTIFVGIPFALELLPALERRWGRRGPQLAVALVAVALVPRLWVVYRAHEPYTAYEQWLGRLLAYTKPFPEHRFLLDESNGDPAHLRAGLPGWASSYETSLLSTRPSPDSAQVLFITDQLPHFVDAGKTPGMFLSAFDVFPSKDLPPAYVRLPNEQATYRLLNTPPPATDTAALGAYIAARRPATITLVDLPHALKAGRPRTVRVRIAAPAGLPLHSGLHTDHPTMLRSQFLDPSVWPTDGAPAEVPLEVDVERPWLQEIPLNCPAKPGKYLLQVSLFSQGFRDWPVLLRVPVEVQ